MRTSPVRVSVLVTAGAVLALVSLAASAGSPPAFVAKEMTLAEHENLQRNLRWMLARAREAVALARHGERPVEPRVGVYADAGAWHESARSFVEALEGARIPCRALDRSLVSEQGLAGLEAVVLPGGWAPFQDEAIGERGREALRRFAIDGGKILGVCAGGYVLSKDVRWLGDTFAYSLALFDGTADGPIEGLAKWPERAAVRIAPEPTGLARGLAVFSTRDVLYYGGSRFVGGGSGTSVLARYPDGSAAVISKKVGHGEIVLSGVHFERPPPVLGGDDAPPPAACGAALVDLLALRR